MIVLVQWTIERYQQSSQSSGDHANDDTWLSQAPVPVQQRYNAPVEMVINSDAARRKRWDYNSNPKLYQRLIVLTYLYGTKTNNNNRYSNTNRLYP